MFIIKLLLLKDQIICYQSKIYYHSNKMISDKDIVNRLQQIITVNQQQYLFLMPLLKQETPERFLQNFLALGSIDPMTLSIGNKKISQAQELGFINLLSKRITESCHLLRREDEQAFIKSLVFLNVTKNFKLKFDSLNGKFPNPLLFLRMKALKISLVVNTSQYQSELKKFLETVKMQNPDEKCPFYEIIVALTPEEKSKAEMDILLSQSLDQQKLSQSKQLYFEKYVSTISPEILVYMLEMRNEKFYQIADQILSLKPEQKDGKWIIQNSCKYGQQFLRQPVRTSILMRYQRWYNHFCSNFFTISEDSIILYYDILQIMDENRYPLYNIQQKFDVEMLKTSFVKIFETLNGLLLQNILEKKKIFYFKNNQLIILNPQEQTRFYNYFYKILQFPFRAAHIHKLYGVVKKSQLDDLFGDGISKTDIISKQQFPGDTMFAGIKKILYHYLREQFIFTSQDLQSLFKYFRWILTASDWISQEGLLTRKLEGQETMRTLSYQIIDKYLKQPNCSGFEYHTGFWILGQKQIKIQNYSQFCTHIFNYLLQNFTCLKIQQTELQPRTYLQCWGNNYQHSRLYMQKFQTFLSLNTQFVKLAFDKWLQQLENLQKQVEANIYQKQHMLNILIIISLQEQFSLNEQLKKRVIKIIISTRSIFVSQQYRLFEETRKRMIKKYQTNIIQILPQYFEKLQKLIQGQAVKNDFSQKRITFKIDFSAEFDQLLSRTQIIHLLLPYSSLQKFQKLVCRLIKLIFKIQVLHYNSQRQMERQYIQMDTKELASMAPQKSYRHHGFKFIFFQQHLQSINKYILNKITLIPTINMIMIELGQVFKFLLQHVEEQGFTLHILYCMNMVKALSDNSDQQFHLQFYLHNKDIIIPYFIKVFTLMGDKFKNNPEDEDYELPLLQFCRKRKQKGLDLKAQIQIFDSKKLNQQLRSWLKLTFSNQQWYYSVIVHSTQYQGLNQLKYFQKAILCDLIHQLQISFSPEKLKAYNYILDIVLNKYHRGGNGDLQFTEKKLQIAAPPYSLKLFFKQEDIKIYYQQIKMFIKQIISHNPQQKLFQELFGNLIGQIKEKQFKQVISKQLMTSSFQQLQKAFNQGAQVAKIEQIIGISISFFQEYDQPIHPFFNTVFLSNLLNYIEQVVGKGEILKQKIGNYIRLLQRLIPKFNKNTYKTDETVIVYVEAIIQLFLKIYKQQKQKKDEENLKKILQKLVRIKENRLNLLIISAYKCLQPNFYSFHQIFSQFAADQLTSISIELQLKGYFFKMKQLNINEVSLQEFSKTFQRYKDKKGQKFIAVLDKITDRKERMQQNINKWYIKLKQGTRYQYSDMQGINFIDFKPSNYILFLLKSFLSAIGQQQKLQGDFDNLSYIAFNYPILIRFIVSCPIRQKQAQIPFIDWAFNRTCQLNKNQMIYDYFDYFFMDINLVMSFHDQIINLSEYLFYRIIKKILNQKLSNQLLLTIFNFSKFTRFCELAFVKISQQYSLVDILWNYLRQTRLQNDIAYGKNLLTSLILSLLYRANSFKLIMNHCQYKNSEEWNDINKYANKFFIPFEHVVIRNQNLSQKDKIQIQNNVPRQKKIYDLVQEQIFNKLDIKAIQIEDYVYKNQLFKNILITEELLKIIDAKVDYQPQLFNDPCQVIQREYYKNHREAKNTFENYFIEKQITDQVKKMRRRRKDFTYEAFIGLNSHQEKQNEQQNYQQLQNQLNVNQQSRFAPQQFVRNRIQAPQEQQITFQKLLIRKFCKDAAPTLVAQIPSQVKNQSIELNQQMLQTFYKINSRLRQINKPELLPNQIQGNTIEAKWQYLKAKDLQTEFDFKEATLGMQQFEEYCLANVNRLDRLNSDRRNIVKNIEDLTLLKYVQRSFSSDSVDYIIDTIDENYQHFNNLARKASVNIDQMIQLPNKIKKKTNYISSSQLQLQIFEDVSEDNLYQLIHSLYYDAKLIRHDYLIPFMENPKVQDKIINTLLFIYRNPFQNGLFPNKFQIFQSQKAQWKQTLDKEEKQQSIREQITTYLTNLMIKSFYEMENCYNRSISKNGIKYIKYQPILTLQTSQLYNPAQQIIQISLSKLLNEDNSLSNDDISGCFKLLRGVSELVGQNEDKLIQFFKKIHKRYEERTNSESDPSNDQVRQLCVEQKQYQPDKNLIKLFQNQSFVQKIKKQFPLVEQRQPFLIALLINLQVYSKQDLLSYHKMLLQKNVIKSSILFYVNKAFALYTDEQLRQCIWMKENKIIPELIPTIPYDQTLKEQPFSRLCHHPQIIPSLFKKRLLYRQIKQYKQKFGYNGKEEIVAQRKKGIFESAFEDLRNIPDGFWYQKFSVKFMGVEGQVQSGYGQGVAKDWYTCVTKGMVNLNYAIFMKSSKNYYFFNRQSWINPRHLQFLQFIGKLFAISIIRQQMFLAPRFSILIYKMILGQKILIEDIIKQFDEGQVINNIQKLRDYEDDSLFCETFVYQDKKLISNKNIGNLSKKQISDNQNHGGMYLLQQAIEIKQEGQGQKQETMTDRWDQSPVKMIKVLKIGETFELVPGGATIPVTIENRQQFITLTKEKIYDITIKSVAKQFQAFMAGFKRIINPRLIRNFTAEELRNLAEGSQQIDLANLKQHCRVNNNIKSRQQIQWFWSILQSFNQRDQVCFLQHWTGLPKAPVDGFKGMNMQIAKGQDDKRVFAQTCFNKITIPDAKSKEDLQEYMRAAVNLIKIGQSVIEDN